MAEQAMTGRPALNEQSKSTGQLGTGSKAGQVHPAHEARKAALAKAMREGGPGARLQKTTTNLFRDRQKAPANRLDVRSMNHVLAVDTEQGLIDCEGMTPYDGLVDATLPFGVLPTVVPELRSITIGGALAGIGIESSSFRYGLVHETVQSFDVLLADGEIVTCRADNEHSDLFFGFPNTFGTLGYALRTIVKSQPAKPYVRVEHRPIGDAETFAQALKAACEGGDCDFVEGEIFGRGQHYLSTGRFTDNAPYLSDYTYKQIYYRSIPERREDYLTARDFIWRWDTDWFWCSKATGAQNPLLRRLVFGRKRLNSRVYMRLLQLSSRYSLLERPYRLMGYRSESVIQDVPIPVEQLATFLDWFHTEIGMAPIWCCPVRAFDAKHRYPLFELKPDQLYVNVGFWDVLRRKEERPRAYYNRLIEAKVKELGGLKSLYSDAFYERDEFDAIYDRATYDRLKARYDPNGRFKDIYDKCILGA